MLAEGTISIRESMAVWAIIQEGGRALALSLVCKAWSDTIGVERKMLSGYGNDN